MKQEEKLGLLLAASAHMTVQVRLAAQDGDIKLTTKLRKTLVDFEKIITEVAK